MCFVVGYFRIVLSLNVKRVYFIHGTYATSCLLKKIAWYPKFCFKEIVIYQEDMEGTDHLEDAGVDERIILKWILR
jgi:hypothetical protein